MIDFSKCPCGSHKPLSEKEIKYCYQCLKPVFWLAPDGLGACCTRVTVSYASSKSLQHPICYGDIRSCEGSFFLSGEQHTGCEACLFGIRQDPTRIERVKQWSPSRYRYYMEDLDYQRLIPLLLSAPSDQLELFGVSL